MCAAQSADIASLQDIFKYLRNNDGANDGQHAPIPGVMWWAWNANSGDTGGITNPPSWETARRPHLFATVWLRQLAFAHMRVMQLKVAAHVSLRACSASSAGACARAWRRERDCQ